MSRTCAWRIDGAWKYSPAAAVPVRTKIPEPMTAPMPSAVSDHGPRDFCSRWPGVSESAISLSIDLQQKSWLSEVRMGSLRSFSEGSVDGWDKVGCLLGVPSLPCFFGKDGQFTLISLTVREPAF